MKLLSDIVYFLTIRPRLNKLKKLLPEASIHPAGSRYVCSPPIMGTDIDFLVYTEIYLDLTLQINGYKKTPRQEYRGLVESGDFDAWRKGRVNLVVTSSRRYAEEFHTATYLCKKYNVLGKWDRIVIHETLRGNTYSHNYDHTYEIASGLIKPLLENMTGIHGQAFHMAYRAKHDLDL